MPSFPLSVFCPMTITSPAPGRTLNGIVDQTGPHGVSIVKWSGHDCVPMSHSWPNDVTTRGCPTNGCVNAVWVISGCPCGFSISSSNIAVMAEPESISTLTPAVAEAPGTVRRPETCCVRAFKCGSVSTVPTFVSPLPPGGKIETRANEIVMKSPHDSCDAGTGSCTGTE